MCQSRARNAGATVGLQHVHEAQFSGCSVERPQGIAADGRAGEESNEVCRPLLPRWVGGHWSAWPDELRIKRASFQGGLSQKRHSLGTLRVYFLDDQRSAHASPKQNIPRRRKIHSLVYACRQLHKELDLALRSDPCDTNRASYP